MADPIDSNGKALDQQPVYDTLINAELMLPQEGTYQPVRVLGRTQASDGTVHGNFNANPILNSILYDVKFPNGEIKEYSANIIAENILNQVDDEGFTVLQLDCILDHRSSDDAVTKDNMYAQSKRGTKRKRKTTVGWELLVRWQDKSEQWISLATLKESNPVDVAVYAKARRIDDEPAFSWWVPYTLRKADIIVAAVKARTRRTTHKYGLEIPRSVSHAYELDRENNNKM